VKNTTPYEFETLRIDTDALIASFVTRSGTPIRCRLIQADDAEILIDLFTHLSPESRRRRFNSSLDNIQPERMAQEAQRLAAVDNRTVGGAILAFAEGQNQAELIAVARLGRLPHAPESPDAEAALVVRDDFQRQGIATRLMILLLHAHAPGEALFALLRHLKLPLERHTTHGETTISLNVADLPVPGKV